MIHFSDLSIGQTVYVNHPGWDGRNGHDHNGWLEVEVSVLVGDCELNPGRTLVEVRSPWLECGWEMYDVENLYPAPDFGVTYETVDIMERVPDNRTYEFGIGDINNANDLYYAETQQVNPTGKKRMVLLKKCDGCGNEFPREWMMNSSSGVACPDCYDRMSL